MSDGNRPKRAYDDRVGRLLRLVEGLVERGHSPRVIELDGLRVELGDYRPPAPRPGTVPPSGVARAIEPGALATADAVESYVRSSVRSYRARAQADLRKRIREDA
jgi:hypothetical protein